MTKKQIKNISASVKQRLLNISKSDERTFNELIQYYAMERFLYRLSQSDYVDSFILKGALALHTRKIEKFRPTMDIDISKKEDDKNSEIIKKIKHILSLKIDEDGIVFNPCSVQIEEIKKDTPYKGTRVVFVGTLDTAHLYMQIDISFRDVVFPEPKEKITFPCILDFPSPKIWCYSLDSIIAEKFEALIKLGDWNSRMKDFYDLWRLSRQYNFQGHQLSKAIELTFKHRNTSLQQEITPFKKEFINKKENEWRSYVKILHLKDPPPLLDIIKSLRIFLLPIVESLVKKTSIPKYWKAPGPWTM